MKKRVMTLLFMLVICLCFASCVFGSEVYEAEEIEVYIKDKIVPVAVGVLTAVIALITTLGSVAKSLNALKDTKESFTSEAENRKEYSKKLERETEKLCEIVKDVPKLEEKLDSLTEECHMLAEILTLGFSSSSEVIKSGKGRQMSLLLEGVKNRKERASDEKA